MSTLTTLIIVLAILMAIVGEKLVLEVSLVC